MPEHGGQNAGHAIGDGSPDRVPLPAHSFDPSQGSHPRRATSPRPPRMLRLAIQQEGELAVADCQPASRCRRLLPV